MPFGTLRHDGGMALEVDNLVGLAVTEAKQRAEDEGVRVKVIVEGEMTSAERGINRVVLKVKEGLVTKAYWG